MADYLRKSNGDPASGACGELSLLFFQLGEVRLEVGEALAHLLDHTGGGARDERFVRELGVRLGDLALEASDLLFHALDLGGRIDFFVKHQARVSYDGDRSIGVWQYISSLE